MVVREERGGVAYSPDGRASVTVEPRVLGGDARIAVKRVPVYELPTGRRVIGGVYDFSATYASSETRIAAFTKGATISLTFRLEELGGTPESSLSIYYFNASTSSWEPVPSKLDRRGRVLTATVDHFSQYSIQGTAASSDGPNLGTPINYGFDIPGHTVIGGPENADFDAAGYLTSIQPANRDFETGDLASWTLSGTGGVDFGGYNNSYYAYIGSNSNLISDEFTIPTDAQTIHFWAFSSGTCQLEVLRASDGIKLRDVWFNAGSTWQEFSFNVSSYRSIAIRLRFLAGSSIDSIQLVRDIPYWETDCQQPNIVSEGGISGLYAQVGMGTTNSSAFTIPLKMGPSPRHSRRKRESRSVSSGTDQPPFSYSVGGPQAHG